jgi:ABC-type dipeptide/oligopeptide/nickel transport system permease component
MAAYVVRRILVAIPVLWGVMTLVFLSIHLLPGDPAQLMLYAKGESNSADVIALRHQLGLDRPLPQQYWNFMTGAAHLDFGTSIASKRPVFAEIADRFPTTVELAAAAMALALPFGIVAGVAAALLRRSGLGRGLMLLAMLGISIPEFWLGTILALVFGIKLGWLPVAGLGDFRNFILPGATLAVGIASFLARVVRASMVDVLGADFIRTARAKGLGERIVVWRHAVRNALIPMTTVLGLTVAGLLGGVVIVENVFALPGVGSLAVGAVSARDFPVIEGTTFFFAVILIAANLVVDLSYALVDPRIRLS